MVVATHNRRDKIGKLLDAMALQETSAPFEVVVVDDGSSDGTWEELERRRERPAVRLRALHRDRAGGPAAARNEGWRAAHGEHILFTDDDCEPHPGWVEALSQALRSGDLGMAQGLTRPRHEEWDGSGPFARTMWVMEEDGFYATCNMGYRREILERIGGFDERFRHPFGEDTDLAWRAIDTGAKAAFVPEAVVFHTVWPSSWTAHLRDRLRREGTVQAVSNHPVLRERFYRPYWYQGSHPRALAAAAGVALAAVAASMAGAAGRSSTAVSGRSSTGAGTRGRRPASTGRAAGLVVAGAALCAPYVHYRLVDRPLMCRPRNRAPVIALAWVADLVEVAVLARASVRHRTLLL